MRGHVRQRGRNWAIVIDQRDPHTGQRKRRWYSFKGTKRLAEVRCAELVAAAQQGSAIEPSRLTTAAFLARFDRDWTTTHLSAQSRRRYGFALHHVEQHLGAKPLQKVCAADVAMLYAALARDGMAPRTIRLVHSVLRRALGQARVWGIIATNPAELAKPPKVADRETAILQPDQAALLLERLRGKPLYLIAALALGTGLRRNEMLALRWPNVDLGAGRLTVDESLEQIFTHGIRIKGPKTKHGRRTISLPTHLVTELREHWREQQEQRLAAGLGKAPADAPVFAAIDGRYLSPNAITKAWAAAMTAIGMPAVTLHSLRHLHASMLIAAGVDILTISRRLGHASPTITLGTYGHLVHGGDDRAATILDAAFGKGSKMVADSAKKLGT